MGINQRRFKAIKHSFFLNRSALIFWTLFFTSTTFSALAADPMNVKQVGGDSTIFNKPSLDDVTTDADALSPMGAQIPSSSLSGIRKNDVLRSGLRVLDWQKAWGSIRINTAADGIGDPGDGVSYRPGPSLEKPDVIVNYATGLMSLCHQGANLVQWITTGQCSTTGAIRDLGYPSTVLYGASSGIRGISAEGSNQTTLTRMDSNFSSRFSFRSSSGASSGQTDFQYWTQNRYPNYWESFASTRSAYLWSETQVKNFDPRNKGELVAHGIKNDFKRSILGCMTRHLANYTPVNAFNYANQYVCNGGPIQQDGTKVMTAVGSGAQKLSNPRFGDLNDPKYGPVYVHLPFWKPQAAEGWNENMGGATDLETVGSGCPQQIYNNCARDINSCTHTQPSDPKKWLAGYTEHDQKGYRHPVTHFLNWQERIDLFAQNDVSDSIREKFWQAGQNPSSGSLQLPKEYWAYTRLEELPATVSTAIGGVERTNSIFTANEIAAKEQSIVYGDVYKEGMAFRQASGKRIIRLLQTQRSLSPEYQATNPPCLVPSTSTSTSTSTPTQVEPSSIATTLDTSRTSLLNQLPSELTSGVLTSTKTQAEAIPSLSQPLRNRLSGILTANTLADLTKEADPRLLKNIASELGNLETQLDAASYAKLKEALTSSATSLNTLADQITQITQITQLTTASGYESLKCTEMNYAQYMGSCCTLKVNVGYKLFAYRTALTPINPFNTDGKVSSASHLGAALSDVLVQANDARIVGLEGQTEPQLRDSLPVAYVEHIDTAARAFVDPKAPNSSAPLEGPAKDLARILTYQLELSTGSQTPETRKLIIADPSEFFDLKRYVSAKAPYSAGDLTSSWNPNQRYGADTSEQARYWKNNLVATPAECPIFGMNGGYSGICDPNPDPIKNAGCNLAIYQERSNTPMEIQKQDGSTVMYNQYPVLWSGYVKNWTVISKQQYLANTRNRIRYFSGGSRALYAPEFDGGANFQVPILRDQILMVERSADYCDVLERSSEVELTKEIPTPDLRCIQYLQMGCLDTTPAANGLCSNYGLVDLYRPGIDSSKLVASFTTMVTHNLKSSGEPDASRPVLVNTLPVRFSDYSLVGSTLRYDASGRLLGGSRSQLVFERTNMSATPSVTLVNGEPTFSGPSISKADAFTRLATEKGAFSPDLIAAPRPGAAYVRPGAQLGALPELGNNSVLRTNLINALRLSQSNSTRDAQVQQALSAIQAKGVGVKLRTGNAMMARVSVASETDSSCIKVTYPPRTLSAAASRFDKSTKPLFIPTNSYSEFNKFLVSAQTVATPEFGNKDQQVKKLWVQSAADKIAVQNCEGTFLQNTDPRITSILKEYDPKPMDDTGLSIGTNPTARVGTVSGNTITFPSGSFGTNPFKPGDQLILKNQGYFVRSVAGLSVQLTKPAPSGLLGEKIYKAKNNNLAAGTNFWVGNLSCEEKSEPATCNATAMINARRHCMLEDAGAGHCSYCEKSVKDQPPETQKLLESDKTFLTSKDVRTDRAGSLLPAILAPEGGNPDRRGRGDAVMRINPFNAEVYGENGGCMYIANCFNKSAAVCAASTTTGGHIFCFGPDTRILLGDGSELTIDRIRPGDEVMAFNALFSRAGDLKPTRVKAVTKTASQRVLKINDLQVTPAHKIVLATGRAVKAEDLHVGDKILRSDGGLEAVRTVESVDSPVDVYNLVLEDGMEGYFANGLKVISYPDLPGI